MNKNNIKIGDVIWANFYGRDHIQKGLRPAVVIQNNKGNYHSPTIQVFPITSKCKKTFLPTHVFIPAGVAGLSKNSIVQCETARTIDKNHIAGYIGHLPEYYMKLISIASIVSMPLISFLSVEQIVNIRSKVMFSS